MYEFKEKAVLPKNISKNVLSIKKEKLESGKFNTISPYIIINEMVKDNDIKAWLKESVVENQLILINAVLNGFDTK